jgi:rhomboid protease GluP
VRGSATSAVRYIQRARASVGTFPDGDGAIEPIAERDHEDGMADVESPGAMTARRGRVPIATIVVGVLTAAVSVVALLRPELLRSLERHPVPDRSWASWRLLGSLLVHDGWAPLAFNLVGFAIVGRAVERRAGAARWSALYLIGGIVGELVGIRWQPVGAGNSVASFGLVGGLVAGLARARSTPPTRGALYAVDWVLVYTGLELGGIPGAVVAGVLCAPLGLMAARTRETAPRALGAALAAGTLALAVVLCAARAIHGPPLIAGALLGLLIQRGPESTSTDP